MRGAAVACVLSLMVLGGAFAVSEALAQSGGQQAKQKERPRPPPLPRCPDLGVGRSAFLSEIPGEAPLREGEIAVRWDVHNDGTAPYVAGAASQQSVALEFTSPAGVRQIAITAVPMRAAAGEVVLAQGASWSGHIRALLPPEAQGRRLRLRLVYAGDGVRRIANDCDTNNNTVNLVRPAQ